MTINERDRKNLIETFKEAGPLPGVARPIRSGPAASEAGNYVDDSAAREAYLGRVARQRAAADLLAGPSLSRVVMLDTPLVIRGFMIDRARNTQYWDEIRERNSWARLCLDSEGAEWTELEIDFFYAWHSPYTVDVPVQVEAPLILSGSFIVTASVLRDDEDQVIYPPPDYPNVIAVTGRLAVGHLPTISHTLVDIKAFGASSPHDPDQVHRVRHVENYKTYHLIEPDPVIVSPGQVIGFRVSARFHMDLYGRGNYDEAHVDMWHDNAGVYSPYVKLTIGEPAVLAPG